jgi:hypothetical protein
MPQLLTHAIGSHHGTAEGEVASPAPVSLVSHLREADEELGCSILAEVALHHHGIAVSDARKLIEESQEKSRELAAVFA